MSAQSLQQMIMRGALDQEFMALMARSPQEAVAQFDLTGEEQSFILGLNARSVKDLAIGVEAWRRGDLSTAHTTPSTLTLATALAR